MKEKTKLKDSYFCSYILIPLVLLSWTSTTYAQSTSFLTDGSLAGQQLSESLWVINVDPGESISGSVSVRNFNAHHRGAVVPFGYTWTWGQRESAIVTVSPWIGTGTTAWNVPINLTAPKTPGTYYILFGHRGEFTMQQVLSATNWNAGVGIIWHDGNDYFDMSPEDLLFAHENGYVGEWPYLFNVGYRSTTVATLPIKVVVGTELQISGLSQNEGGDTGSVTLTIRGNGFEEGATVKLTGPDSDILGDPVNVAPNGRSITTTFDLNGRMRGLWDVVVENPNGNNFVFSAGFTIVEGRNPEIVADIIGLPVIRANRAQTYWVFVRNTGNIDAVFPDESLLLSVGVFSADDPSLPIASSFKQIGSVSRAATAEQCEAVCNAIIDLEEELDDLNRQLRELREARADTDDEDEKRAIRRAIKNKEKEIGELELKLGTFKNWKAQNCPASKPDPNPDPIMDPIIPIDDPIIIQFPIIVPEPGCYIISPLLTSFGGGAVASTTSLFSTSNPDGKAFATSSDILGSFDGQEKEVCVVTSFDPNDKVGGEGVGEEHYISGGQPLSYAIFFENLETATAPAQEVIITDQLDTENMDLDTLSLGPIAFGEKQVVPPAGTSNFTADVDLRPNNDLIVRIEVSLNPNTGLLAWHFKSLDPETEDFPDDPLAGFLPPNLNPPEGDGSVLFTVMPKESLPTGTETRNQAEIIFDLNEPIVTPEWLNTLDNTEPTSQVLPVPVAQNSLEFLVEWSGSDEGAGIKDFTIFVSENDEDYIPFIVNTPETSATFSGESGKTYTFFSIARDKTGNVEDKDSIAEAVTTVVVGPSDTTAPVVTPPSDITVEAEGPTGIHAANPVIVAFLSGASAMDDVDGNVPVTNDAPAVFPLGVTKVTFSALDRAGNTGSATVNVTVEEMPKPIQDLTGRGKLTKINLVWSLPPEAVSYNIYRSTNEGGPYDLIVEGYVTDFGIYLDTGLTTRTHYCYVVRWVNESGQESPNSNEVCVMLTNRRRR